MEYQIIQKFNKVLAVSRISRISLATLVLIIFSWNVDAGTITGLDFPGSAAVATSMRFKFTNPQSKGLPAYDATYIWRAYPRHQAGYYTAFFWGNDDGKGNLDTFLWDNGGAGLYYGAHPYPRGGAGGNVHDWEIALRQNDFVNGQVVYDRWYVQAFRAWSDQNGKHHQFFWDLPKTDAAHMVSVDIPSDENNTNPPSPALTWGDAPWNVGNEVWDGILRGIQIYSSRLSITDILKESQTPRSSSSGSASIWYLNLNPSPTDILDKSGKGHHPVWVGNERPALYIATTSDKNKNPPASQAPGIISSMIYILLSYDSSGRSTGTAPNDSPVYLGIN